jgi:hypothetical protein
MKLSEISRPNRVTTALATQYKRNDKILKTEKRPRRLLPKPNGCYQTVHPENFRNALELTSPVQRNINSIAKMQDE